MPRILITGARAPAALDLARQFAAAGHQIFVADSAPCMLAQSSSSIVRSFRLPPPRQQPAAFAAELQRIICANGIELVVPTCEEVFYVAAFKGELAQHAMIFCPDLPVLKRLHSKWEFTRLLADESLATASVAAPETWLLTSPSGLDAIPADPADLVFKPEFSRFAVHTLIRPGSDAVGRIPMADDRPWVAQRYVSGREVCSYSIVDGGRILAHAAYEPAWRAGHGAGTYFQPFAAPEILEFVTRLAAHLNISGQLAFDFIQTGPGQFCVLECNPRATSGVHLFGSGDRLADAFLGIARTAIAPSQSRPRMLASAMLLFGFPRALVSGRFRHLARDFRQARDVLWSAADPLPLFYSFAGIAAFAGLALFRQISPQAATTLDIEWDGRPIR